MFTVDQAVLARAFKEDVVETLESPVSPLLLPILCPPSPLGLVSSATQVHFGQYTVQTRKFTLSPEICEGEREKKKKNLILEHDMGKTDPLSPQPGP